MSLEVVAVPGIPEIREGDDLGAAIVSAVGAAGLVVAPGDVLVVASKVVAKAHGLRRYASRDAVVDDETVRVVAERRTGGRVTRVVESAAGPVMAATGVDESNVGADGGVSGGRGSDLPTRRGKSGWWFVRRPLLRVRGAGAGPG